MFAPHFRDRVDLPKKSTTWNPAYINETEPRPVLFALYPTGSRAKKNDVRGFERAEVESGSGRAVSRESRVGGELKGADEESRAGCWVRLEVAFLVHHAAKVRLNLAFVTPQKRPPNAFFFKHCLEGWQRAVRGTKTERRQTRRGSRWPAVLWCSVSRSNRRGDGRGGGRGVFIALE